MWRDFHPWCVVLAFLVFGATESKAEQISFSQSGTHVIATLSGITCGAGIVNPVGFVATPVIGNHFFVYSGIVGCPGGTFPLVPYTSTVDLGPLSDGNYVVTWGFITPFGPVGSQFTASASVVNGTLFVFDPSAIPSLSVQALGLLSVSIVLGFAYLAQRRITPET